ACLDVIDMKRQRIDGSGQVTILASVLRALPDLPGSRVMAIMRLSLESNPGLGFHDSQEVSNVQVAVEFGLLFSSQRSGFRPFRQLLHSPPVRFVKVNRQQELGGFR